MLGIAELEKRVGPLLLLLLPVKLKNGQIDVVKQLRMIFNAIAAGKEDLYD